MAASLMVYVNGRSCLVTKMVITLPFLSSYVTKDFNREKKGLILLSVPKEHGLIYFGKFGDYIEDFVFWFFGGFFFFFFLFSLTQRLQVSHLLIISSS